MSRKMMAAAAALMFTTVMTFAQGAAPKPTDPQIAHIAYTAGSLDIAAAKQAWPSRRTKTSSRLPMT